MTTVKNDKNKRDKFSNDRFNLETLESFEEVEKMKRNRSIDREYTDVDEMIQDLPNDQLLGKRTKIGLFYIGKRTKLDFKQLCFWKINLRNFYGFHNIKPTLYRHYTYGNKPFMGVFIVFTLS